MRLRTDSGLLRRSLIAACLVLAGPVLAAVEVEGVMFEENETVAGQKLVLNGATASQVLSVKATAVGMYLANKTNTAEGAFAMKGAKRLRVVALRDITAKDLANTLLDRIRQNATRDEVENNILQLAALGGAFNTRPKLVKGDVATWDWNPVTKSTEVRVNGEQVTQPIQGETFFPVIMKVWLGPKVKPATRNNLLGVPNAG
ncbi:chalcone isomerase family protein [Niveibacterium sp. 24ML]|uniref:chalcone isomerase family protein n=1 Tax=Niveibacterium sp. 24ML TaxID=2985512 RepID=UPI00226D57F1|nr:chalcone isomerase family protein [Niveibacterium sp. 24ML]MCX9154791.1 chalcone isomerase family protein [Niveibacterium sp. 24ML]